MLRRNNFGEIYFKGKSSPDLIRSRILLSYCNGETIRSISESVQLTEQGMPKIIKSYLDTNSILPKVPC